MSIYKVGLDILGRVTEVNKALSSRSIWYDNFIFIVVVICRQDDRVSSDHDYEQQTKAQNSESNIKVMSTNTVKKYTHRPGRLNT